MANDIFTTDDSNNAAVRTVSVKAGATETNQPDIFTTDENGNAAVRVVGSGGSIDEDKVIIKSAEIPQASADVAGQMYCYDGTTDSTYTHGYVYECVEGETTYTDTVEFEPASVSGTVVTATSNALANLCGEYITGDITSIVSGTMTYDESGEIWVFVGKDAEDNTVGSFQLYTQDFIDAGFTFTGTLQDGDVVAFTCTITESSTYVWERIDLQPAPELGRYLSTWNCATGLAGTNPPTSPYTYKTGDYFIVGVVATGGASNYKPNGSSYVTGQASTTVETNTVAINDTYFYDGTNWTLLKTGSAVTSVNGQTGAVTIGINDILPTQTGYSGRVLGTDGFVAGWVEPEIVQRDTMPQADENEVGNIYQFVGTTDANYTNGYFYKCVSDGQQPATYSWTQVNVQPSVDPLPNQSGQSGKYLTTNGTTASWGSVNALQNNSTALRSISVGFVGDATTSMMATNIGFGATANQQGASYGAGAKANNYAVALGNGASAGSNAVAVGQNCNAANQYSISIGTWTTTTGNYAIQLGGGASNSWVTNADANTFKVGNANGNYEIMSADGTMPTDRFTTTPSADGTYVPTLTISSGVATRSWAAPSGGGGSATSTTATLATADWSSNTQTVNVTGVTASNNVIVSAAPASQADYTAAGVICTAQGAGTLTFTCTTTPSSALTVNVLII